MSSIYYNHTGERNEYLARLVFGEIALFLDHVHPTPKRDRIKSLERDVALKAVLRAGLIPL